MMELFLALLRGLTAFLVTNGMSIVLPAGELGFRRMQPMSWIWIAVFAVVWFVLRRVSQIRTGRVQAFVFALFCMLTTLICYYFKTWYGFRRVCSGVGAFLIMGVIFSRYLLRADARRCCFSRMLPCSNRPATGFPAGGKHGSSSVCFSFCLCAGCRGFCINIPAT